MKEKLKGLVVGLLVGSMITGSVAYAANSKSINVYLRELKFKFDGTDKPSASSTGFIYNNTVYVPAKSIAGAIGKTITFDDKTGTVSIGSGKEVSPTIAVYKGGKITQAEFDVFQAASSFYFGQAVSSDKQAAVKQLIAFKLLAAKKATAFSKEAASAATADLLKIKEYFGSAEEFASQLKTAKLTESSLSNFIKQQFLASKTLESMIDNQALQDEYDRQRKADSAAFVTANVRHILVATTDNATGKALRTEAEALVRAKEVQTKLTAGGDFTKLTTEYSDDPGSKGTGGLYADATLTQFVVEFKKAAVELPLNQISDPVKTSYGYHVMKVESRVIHTLKEEEVKNQLISGLLNQTYQKYTENELPALIQSIKLPVAP